MKRKINPIQAIKANARNLLALCCLGLLVSASLLLPEALIRWQNGRILGIFQPQPQQQAQLSNSRLSFQEKLSLLSGGVFYNGIQAYFSDPLPYWRDLDYNYLAIESDYRVAVSMAADITISPLLTGNRYDPESALSQCWNQLDRLTAYDKWFAQYTSKNKPDMYYDYRIWQYTDSGSVPGIEGKVDMNLAFLPYY